MHDDFTYPLDCGHCGFPGPVVHKQNVAVSSYVEGEFQRGGIIWDTLVAIHLCPKCDETTVWQYVWSDELVTAYETRRLHPPPTNDSTIPQRVRNRLAEALQVKKVNANFYAVGMRRTLETVCNEEGAVGKDLFTKLDDLVAKGRIPQTLADAGHALRELGNLGAHDKETDVVPADIPVIAEFVDAILEYLYRAPAKIAAMQQDLAHRQAQATAKTSP